MTPQTFLFFGRSGCGKGTQAKLLIDLLQKATPDKKTFYIETGQRLREFSQEIGLSAKLTADTMASGGLLPSFIPIWIWTNYFVRHMTGDEHLVLDGLSRRAYEAPILGDALQFYNRPTPTVIIVNVSRAWAKDRLTNRGRADDSKLDIEARLDWYDTNVVPAIDYFKQNAYYRVIEINGEQPIEAVHAEILAKTGLSEAILPTAPHTAV
jgi:adenylate kinase family enzyme